MPYKDPEAKRAYNRQQMRRYRAADPEKYRIKGRAWFASLSPDKLEKRRAYNNARNKADYAANPAKYAQRGKEQYAKHKAKILAAQAAYRANNKVAINAKDRAYYARNKARYLTYSAKRRAKKARSLINDFTPAQWRQLQAAFDHRCAYCGKRAKGHLTQDHITPIAKGGSHTLHNIVPACSACNGHKYTGPAPKPVQPLLL